MLVLCVVLAHEYDIRSFCGTHNRGSDIVASSGVDDARFSASENGVQEIKSNGNDLENTQSRKMIEGLNFSTVDKSRGQS